MTVQISDIYRYNNEEYDNLPNAGLNDISDTKLIIFNPRSYGIEPQPVCTGCWAGFWCEYEITDNKLILKDMYINSKNNFYPAINGVEAEEEEMIDDIIPNYLGHHLYKNINLPMDYTGSILVGSNYVEGYEGFSGYNKACSYEKILEFTFDKGNLVNISDKSEIGEKQRKLIDEDPSILYRDSFADDPNFDEEFWDMDLSDIDEDL